MEVSFKETELCLSLPGSGGGGGGGSSLVIEAEIVPKATGKRGFVDLELNLQSEDRSELTDLNETVKKSNNSSSPNDMSIVSSSAATKDPAKPPTKAQVVGWPPVRSYRKDMMAPQKDATAKEDEKKGSGAFFASFVKVSMDGAPYLRKVDLETFGSYKELSDALTKMFSSFTMGNYGAQGMIDFMNESKLMDFLNSSDYVPTYEDKDGDWMLVGDVPWEMFVESCKRLRIMKGSEAIGIAPRAMEKCKSRN